MIDDPPNEVYENMLSMWKKINEQRPRPFHSRYVSMGWWRRAMAPGPHTVMCEKFWSFFHDHTDHWPDNCCEIAGLQQVNVDG